MMVATNSAAAPALAQHQQAAVVRLTRILRTRRGAVLADEPGLGKTWVAAAMAARSQADGIPVEVVSPAPLRGYWRDVMRRFGVASSVVSHESLVRESEWGDLVRGTRLVIVDEAHRFRNPLTKRYEGLARRSINARMLLVTATPVCNSPVDLLSLLKLIVADDELEDLGVPSVSECFGRGDRERETVVEELVVRRSVMELEGLTPARRDVTLVYEPTRNAEELRQRFECLTFPWMSRRVSRGLLLLFLERRLESSIAAFAATIRRMSRVCRRARLLASRGATLPASEIRAVLGDPEAQSFQDILFPELWGAEMREGAAGEREYDEELERLGEIAKCVSNDPKLELLEAIVRPRAGTPGLVFTVSYDTAWSVYGEMSRSLRCALLTGRRCVAGGRRRDIDSVVASLRAGQLELVVATDVGGEGLNLETAGYVVHYDQPWNPAILEQRNGRICRIGQRRLQVESFELVTVGSRSRDVVRRKREELAGLWFNEGRGGGERIESSTGWRPPSRLDSGRVQARVVQLLRARGLSSGELVDLLSIRHREGVERRLDRFVRQSVDAEGVMHLRVLLRGEVAMISADDGAI